MFTIPLIAVIVVALSFIHVPAHVRPGVTSHAVVWDEKFLTNIWLKLLVGCTLISLSSPLLQIIWVRLP